MKGWDWTKVIPGRHICAHTHTAIEAWKQHLVGPRWLLSPCGPLASSPCPRRVPAPCWALSFVMRPGLLPLAHAEGPEWHAACCVWLFVTTWTTARQASLSFTIPWSLFKLMSMELVMPSNHLILSCPLLLLSSIFPSIKVFSNEPAVCVRWSKYWSFSISPYNEYPGLISLCLDLLGV